MSGMGHASSLLRVRADLRAGHLWIALFTFLYIDLLDCTGTLLSMAQVIDNMMPGAQLQKKHSSGLSWWQTLYYCRYR